MTMHAKKFFKQKPASFPLSYAFYLLAAGLILPQALADLPRTGDARTSQRSHQIEAALENGHISPLQAEFMLLRSRRFDSPQDRFMAMREWQAKNGVAMKAEMDARRALDEPKRQARLAAARQARAAQIAEGVASGRLGPLEAELASLTNSEYANPGERMQSIRAWHAKNHDAFDAERQARYGTEPASRTEQAAEIQAHRERSIAQAAADGRIGPLEAEFLMLRGQNNPNLKERQTAIRAWLDENGEALKNERANRATSNP